MLRRFSTGVLLDLLAVAGFIALGWFSSSSSGAPQTSYVYTPRDGLYITLLVLVAAPALAWRRWPMPAFLVSLLALATMWVLGYDASGLPLILPIGMYWVATLASPRQLGVSFGIAFVCLSTLLWIGGAPFTLVEWTASIATLGLAAALGRAGRLRGDLAEARTQAAEEASRRRIGEERLRISGELHDVVGHSLGTIAVQAGIGHYLMDREPARASQALEHISRISRRSLDEMRSIVANLRDHSTEYGPPLGLTDVEELVATARATGLEVILTLPDDPDSMPQQTSAAVFRVIREALTNVIRHAGASTVQVTVCRSASSVDISVRDDGYSAALPSKSPTRSGYGLALMRERVEALGGKLDTGTQQDGGFLVSASLPVEPIR